MQESCKQRNWISFKESKELQSCACWSSRPSVLTFTFGYTWNKFQEKKNHVRIQRKLTAFYKEIPKIKNPLCVFCNQITCYPVLDETIIKYDEKWRWFYCSVVKQNRSRNSKNRGFCEVGNPRWEDCVDGWVWNRVLKLKSL
jgi:hypothetical protein